jgi:sugar lactone lactonase YvrE
MRRGWGAAAFAACALVVFAASAQASTTAQNVQVSVLTAFPAGGGPAAAAATNNGDVVALAGSHVVGVNPNGKQNPLPLAIAGGAFGFPIGIAYDTNHRLYAALPGSFGPLPSGAPGVLQISPDGKSATPVPGSEGMVAADGFGLDSSTGDLYVTDIYGNAIWRITPDGTAHLWTSVGTNPLLVLPDGVKVFQNAVYTSVESGKILRIPINPDGSAGTAQVWAEVPGPAFFDDMVLDDRTGDVYVTRLDTNELLQITPAGVITPIATNADGLLGAANMVLTHVGQSTVIFLANGAQDFLGTGESTFLPPSLLKITIS